MGTSSLLDVLGSIIIGGFLLLSVYRLNGNVAQTRYTTGSDLTVQENMVSLVCMIEEDFRKIGYCANPANIPNPAKAIVSATQNSIEFLTDVDKNGIVDTLSYFLGSSTSANNTPNPRDRKLFRQVNNKIDGFYIGTTQFDFLYYDALADSLLFPITVPSAIYGMRLSVTLESAFAYDTLYSYAYWRQLRLAARNLRNR